MVLYRKEDIEKIFNREKLLVGRKDEFPEYKAVEIFGKDAVEFSRKLGNRGSTTSCFGIGDYQFHYLTLEGLEIAATYVNICNVRDAITRKGR